MGKELRLSGPVPPPTAHAAEPGCAVGDGSPQWGRAGRGPLGCQTLRSHGKSRSNSLSNLSKEPGLIRNTIPATTTIATTDNAKFGSTMTASCLLSRLILPLLPGRVLARHDQLFHAISLLRQFVLFPEV